MSSALFGLPWRKLSAGWRGLAALPRHGVASAANLLYPQDCAACGNRLSAAGGAPLCEACLGALPLIGPWSCRRCGVAVGSYVTWPESCPSCRDSIACSFDGAVAVCRYDGPAREMVHQLKYRGETRAAKWMGGQMAARVRQAEWAAGLDAIVPVPLHWKRRIARRFNQSEILARAISRELGVPTLPNALRRIRNTAAQALLDPHQRMENVRGAFRVECPELISGRTVLLVDDVMTTCATAAQCSKALIGAGASRVYVAVFAR